jgi:hypothetical protein
VAGVHLAEHLEFKVDVAVEERLDAEPDLDRRIILHDEEAGLSPLVAVDDEGGVEDRQRGRVADLDRVAANPDGDVGELRTLPDAVHQPLDLGVRHLPALVPVDVEGGDRRLFELAADDPPPR